MKAWTLGDQRGLGSLTLSDLPTPQPNAGETLVKVNVAALNHRDLLALHGTYGPRKAENRVLLSDGIGTIEAIAGDDHGHTVGQRIIAPHFAGWIDGPFSPAIFGQDVGISRDGWLAEYICLPTASLVPLPNSISDEVAVTLAAAGTTVWHGLVEFAGVKAGDIVLAQGTGGVAMMTLHIAKALGAKVAITSSSDDKLEKCRELGADFVVNYRTRPDWAAALLEQTNDRGADIVIDTAGLGEIEQTLAFAAPNGRIALIGGLSGALDHAPNMFGMIGKNLTLKGITSGSRTMLAKLVDTVADHGINPLIDRTFPFAEADQACAHLDRGGHMGKVIIQF